MTADSLKGIPAVSVTIKGSPRGTITNEQGVFSIVVLKGDEIEFSSVGYKPKLVTIPKNIEGSQYSLLQLMVNDTIYLAATIIKAKPSREQFEREFLNTVVPDDQLGDEVTTLAAKLAAGPTLSFASMRQSVNYSSTHDLVESLAFEAGKMNLTGASEDHRNAVAAFVAKEKPTFSGR